MVNCNWVVVYVWKDGSVETEFFATREGARNFVKSIKDAINRASIHKV